MEAREETIKRSSDKMGTMPINKLLISMAWPMMVSMLVQALYNIVDSIFVAHIANGTEALTALTLAFPIQNLMIAFGSGTGVGVNALLSRALGEGKYEKANKVARNGIFLILVNYIIFLIFGILGVKTFIMSQSSNSIVIGYGRDYLSIVTIFSFGLFAQMLLERLLQSTGNTIYSMVSQLVGAAVNIILDPVFIFALNLNAKGAAIATVIGQVVAMFTGIYLNVHKNKDLNLNMIKFKPELNIIKGIYSVGIPSILMQAVTSITTYCVNRILETFSCAVAVYGVFFKLNSFIFMPIFGMNNGAVPIIAYNYGAKNKKRIKDTIVLALKIACGIMVVGLLIFQFATKQLFMMFNADNEMLKVGIPALRIISTSFIFAGACIIMITALQSLGNGFSSMIIALCRQIGVIVPVTYILSRIFGLPIAWLSFPLAEVVSLILSIFLLKRVWKKKVSSL